MSAFRQRFSIASAFAFRRQPLSTLIFIARGMILFSILLQADYAIFIAYARLAIAADIVSVYATI
jgi:hypothetical protein